MAHAFAILVAILVLRAIGFVFNRLDDWVK